MLAHATELLEYRNGMVAIHPRFNKLITALRTAVENGEGMLDKEATSHDDLMDAFRMSLLFWHQKKTREVCSSHYMMLLSSGRLAAATVTFSAGEEFIYTLIFVIYSGVSNDTPFFSLWILDNFISSTLVTWRQLCLNRLALACPISFMTS